MQDAVIVSSVRTAVGKSGKGTLRATRPDELGAIAIRSALERVPQVDVKEIEDVIGQVRATPGWNVERGGDGHSALATHFDLDHHP